MKFVCLALLTTAGLLSQATPDPTLAVPLDPITTILEAFKTHDIVALGEPHGNEPAAAFRVALVRDPRFAGVVDDIVVESFAPRFREGVRRALHG